jgi:hypothetical protein
MNWKQSTESVNMVVQTGPRLSHYVHDAQRSSSIHYHDGYVSKCFRTRRLSTDIMKDIRVMRYLTSLQPLATFQPWCQ